MSSANQILLNSSDHLISYFRSLSKARCEIVLNLFEFLAIALEFALHVTELDSFAPVLTAKLVVVTNLQVFRRTRAANVNSRSSDTKDRSVKPVSMHSFKYSSFR